MTTIGLVNVPDSTIAREADAVLPTRAGPEIGVATTGDFTAQLTVLLCFMTALARQRPVGRGFGEQDTQADTIVAGVDWQNTWPF